VKETGGELAIDDCRLSDPLVIGGLRNRAIDWRLGDCGIGRFASRRPAAMQSLKWAITNESLNPPITNQSPICNRQSSMDKRMPYFTLTYEVVDNYTEKRTPYRAEHLQKAREAAARGELVMAGALGDPAGALLVFRASDKSLAEAFATRDPYVTNGLVTRWTVRPWSVVIGQDPAETPPGLPT